MGKLQDSFRKPSRPDPHRRVAESDQFGIRAGVESEHQGEGLERASSIWQRNPDSSFSSLLCLPQPQDRIEASEVWVTEH